MPGPTPLTTPHDSSIALCTFTQRCNKVPIGYNGTPQIHPPNFPFPFDDHHQNLIHPYRARPHSPPETASGSNQPCCHCSHVRTDRREGRMFDHISAPLYRQRRDNNMSKGPQLICDVTGRPSGTKLRVRMSAPLRSALYPRPRTEIFHQNQTSDINNSFFHKQSRSIS